MQLGLNLDTQNDGLGGSDNGFLISADFAPEIRVGSSSPYAFKIGTGLKASTAIYYVRSSAWQLVAVDGALFISSDHTHVTLFIPQYAYMCGDGEMLRLCSIIGFGPH